MVNFDEANEVEWALLNVRKIYVIVMNSFASSIIFFSLDNFFVLAHVWFDIKFAKHIKHYNRLEKLEILQRKREIALWIENEHI